MYESVPALLCVHEIKLLPVWNINKKQIEIVETINVVFINNSFEHRIHVFLFCSSLVEFDEKKLL